MKKKSRSEFLAELEDKNPRVLALGVYDGNHSRIHVRCKECGYEWDPIVSGLLRGHGCPKCAGVKRKTREEFVKDLEARRDDVVIIGEYEKALKKTRFRFLECGHECDITPAHILSGRGCPECGKLHRRKSLSLAMDVFERRLREIDPNLVVREGGCYVNNRTPVPLRCESCGYEYDIPPHDALNQKGCPNCHKSGTSFLEKFIYHSLIKAVGEAKVLSRDKSAIGLELDIYVPDLNLAVEPGSWYWHKKWVGKDWEKQVLCRDKGIKLITIYDHYQGEKAPFDNCLVSRWDLSLDRNEDKLIHLVKDVFGIFGLSLNWGAEVWEEIKRPLMSIPKK